MAGRKVSRATGPSPDPNLKEMGSFGMDSALRTADSRRWLARFLLGILLVFLGLAASFTTYNLVCASEASEVQASIQKGGLDGLGRAAELLGSPHLFAGYEVYHGFGRESSAQWQTKAQQIMEQGEDYSEVDLGFLIHRPDHFLAAWPQVRNAQNPPVGGDSIVMQTILQRQQNAIQNVWVFVVYQLVVAGILVIPWWLFHRRRPAAG